MAKTIMLKKYVTFSSVPMQVRFLQVTGKECSGGPHTGQPHTSTLGEAFIYMGTKDILLFKREYI